MKHIRKFNEAELNNLEFEFDEYKDKFVKCDPKDEFFEGSYVIKNDYATKNFEFKGDKYKIMNVYKKDEDYSFEFGIAILKNDDIEYIMHCFEPHGFDVKKDKGVVVLYGHEDVILLWLEDGDSYDIEAI